ncbi:hypothetical protein B0H19DRAFT_1085769 [Mycena capillaripes]|nr:hypothetical protein B0H19DRAFT_1085769 [Mycena capillaripes]
MCAKRRIEGVHPVALRRHFRRKDGGDGLQEELDSMFALEADPKLEGAEGREVDYRTRSRRGLHILHHESGRVLSKVYTVKDEEGAACRETAARMSMKCPRCSSSSGCDKKLTKAVVKPRRQMLPSNALPKASDLTPANVQQLPNYLLETV